MFSVSLILPVMGKWLDQAKAKAISEGMETAQAEAAGRIRNIYESSHYAGYTSCNFHYHLYSKNEMFISSRKKLTHKY